MNRSTIRSGAAWTAILVVAALPRFMALGRCPTRADELNMLNYGRGAKTLAQLWTHPPWLNQIPLTDSIPVVWSNLQPWRTVDEGMVREPFALLGWLTVAGCAGWLMRRRGAVAGLLAGVWLAVLPFHVYHSREAYYYVVTMAMGAGMMLRGADFAARLRSGEPLGWRAYAEWSLWALAACMGHMSAWVVAATTGLVIVVSGLWGVDGALRRRHALAMSGVVLALALGMSRWIYRAILEMQRVQTAPHGHIGSDFAWIAPRVLPFFVAGANWIGIGILAAVAVAAAIVWRRGRGQAADPRYAATTWIVGGGLLGSYAYILAIGGATAKLSYFAVNAPAFVIWCAMTLDRAFGMAWPAWRVRLDGAMALVLAAVLSWPVAQIVRLEGKATPYVLIREWLDEHLAPGDVVIVDRWLEPWNEMALYAPTHVFVGFTVPDDTYDEYMRYNWRGVTREVFEGNGAQAFLRLARNQEKRLGLWTWPETYFRRRAEIPNTAGVKLRDSGYAPMEEFYTEHSRLVPEVFYDTREDKADRVRAAGQSLAWFFDRGWRLFKPWQHGDFNDYRVLEDEAVLEVHNVTERTLRARVDMVAVASGGPSIVRVGESGSRTVPEGRLSETVYEVELVPGINRVLFQRTGGGVLLVRSLRMQPMP